MSGTLVWWTAISGCFVRPRALIRVALLLEVFEEGGILGQWKGPRR
jgi:hypothetical protein